MTTKRKSIIKERKNTSPLNAKKATSDNSGENLSKRKKLSNISFYLDEVKTVDASEFIVTKKQLPTRESLTEKFSQSEVGKANEQLTASRKKLESEMEDININIQEIVDRARDVPESEKRQIMQEFESRKNKGTINEKQLELTIALEGKVKSIRDAGKKARKILNSSSLKHPLSKDSQDLTKVSVEEHRVNTIPKNSLKPILTNKTNKKVLISLSILTLALIIVLIVVFVI